MIAKCRKEQRVCHQQGSVLAALQAKEMPTQTEGEKATSTGRGSIRRCSIETEREGQQKLSSEHRGRQHLGAVWAEQAEPDFLVGGLLDGPGVVLEEGVEASVQRVAAIVLVGRVPLAVQDKAAVGDAVGHAAHDAAKVGGVAPLHSGSIHVSEGCSNQLGSSVRYARLPWRPPEGKAVHKQRATQSC